jgi:hypothetical protein
MTTLMPHRNDEVKIIEGYVEEAKSHVQQQTIIVEQLRRAGSPTSDAEKLLAAYQESLATHQAHLDIAREEALARSKLIPPMI